MIYNNRCLQLDRLRWTAPQGKAMDFRAKARKFLCPLHCELQKPRASPLFQRRVGICTDSHVNHPDSYMILRWATRNPCQLLNFNHKKPSFGVPLPLAPCSAGRILWRHSISISSGPGYVNHSGLQARNPDSSWFLHLAHHGSSWVIIQLVSYQHRSYAPIMAMIGISLARQLEPRSYCALSSANGRNTPRLVRNSPAKWCLQGTAPWNLQQNWSKRTIVSEGTFQYYCVKKECNLRTPTITNLLRSWHCCPNFWLQKLTCSWPDPCANGWPLTRYDYVDTSSCKQRIGCQCGRAELRWLESLKIYNMSILKTPQPFHSPTKNKKDQNIFKTTILNSINSSNFDPSTPDTSHPFGSSDPQLPVQFPSLVLDLAACSKLQQLHLVESLLPKGHAW